MPSSKGSSQLRDRTQASCHCRWILYHLSHQRSHTHTHRNTHTHTHTHTHMYISFSDPFPLEVFNVFSWSHSLWWGSVMKSHDYIRSSDHLSSSNFISLLNLEWVNRAAFLLKTWRRIYFLASHLLKAVCISNSWTHLLPPIPTV